jgi:hypothetical protein
MHAIVVRPHARFVTADLRDAVRKLYRAEIDLPVTASLLPAELRKVAAQVRAAG